MICVNKEKSYQDIIDEMQTQIELETKCHQQIMDYLEESKNVRIFNMYAYLKWYLFKSACKGLYGRYSTLDEKIR